MVSSNIEKARKFIEREGDRYLALLRLVREAAVQIQRELGSAGIYSIYSRATKQGTSEFKAVEKIAHALANKTNEAEKGGHQFYSVTDIVGVSVVTYYSDMIAKFALLIKQRLRSKAYVTKENMVKQGGYVGLHIVFRSATSQICCELQIKTMLHDAWAAKMHDLNYKPKGETDKRLSLMMETLGSALESIETQSQIIRDLIQERWNAESKRREAVSQLILGLGKDWWLEWWKTRPLGEAASKLMAEIEELDKCNTVVQRDRSIAKLNKKMDFLEGINERDKFWLALLMLLKARTGSQLERAADCAQAFLDSEGRSLDSVTASYELTYVPLVFSICGDLDRAIGAGEFLLENARDATAEFHEMVMLNHANFLIEKACFGAPMSRSEKTTLRVRVEKLMQGCGSLKERDPSCFADLEGMLIVATSEDIRELRRAIDLIYLGKEASDVTQKEFADECFELHIRVAWQRLLEVEKRPIFQRILN